MYLAHLSISFVFAAGAALGPGGPAYRTVCPVSH